ncbi:MAG: hypothetical protein ACI9LM_003299 [Alteromonadaceae bacterium]|jgi:hypothetical protein
MQLDGQISSIYFIGDVHAQHTKLEALLTEIDFVDTDPESACERAKLVFIGDLIDNKVTDDDQHVATLQTIHTLQKNKHAFCLLGNHEFNAVGWASKNANGEFCRPHNDKNTKQHRAFLNAVGEGSAEHNRWIYWFKSLPLFLSFETVNAIHACWDEQAIERLKPYLNADHSLKEVHWIDAFNEQHELFELCEALLKGPERTLPDGEFFIDKTGTKRTQERVKWWHEYQGNKPVVIGHYTLTERPEPLTNKVVCVDYNAAKDDNVLVAYRVDAHLDENDEQLFATQYGFEYIDKPNFEYDCNISMIELLSRSEKQFSEQQGDALSEKEQQLYEYIGELIWTEWDPVGVNDIEECRDEYYNYESSIYLFSKYAPLELSGYLYMLQMAYFEISTENSKERCEIIARKINRYSSDLGINAN